MYEIFLKRDVTDSWTTLPCLKLSHLLGPPPPRAWRALWTDNFISLLAMQQLQ